MAVSASPVDEVAPEPAVCASPVEGVAPAMVVSASLVEGVAPEIGRLCIAGGGGCAGFGRQCIAGGGGCAGFGRQCIAGGGGCAGFGRQCIAGGGGCAGFGRQCIAGGGGCSGFGRQCIAGGGGCSGVGRQCIAGGGGLLRISVVSASPVEGGCSGFGRQCIAVVEGFAPDSAVCASPAGGVTSLPQLRRAWGRSSANHSPTPIAATTSRMTSVRRPARPVGCSVSFGTRHFLFPARSTGGVGLRPGGHFRHRRPKPGPTGETDVSHYCNPHDTPSHDAECRRRHRPIPEAANRPRQPESASPRSRRVQVATGPTTPVSFPRTVQHAR